MQPKESLIRFLFLCLEVPVKDKTKICLKDCRTLQWGVKFEIARSSSACVQVETS
jgi:hypothetical protein